MEEIYQYPEERVKELCKKYKGATHTIKREVKAKLEEYNAYEKRAILNNNRFFIKAINEWIEFKRNDGEQHKHFHDESPINLSYLKLLEDKKLFDKITIEEMDKKIVREIPTRRCIFLCANGRLVKNCQIASYNLLVNDEAGAGKDYVTSKVLQMIPKEQYIKKTRISPTVFTYWHNSLYEPEWTWNGKVFYTEDISEPVLNSEVFKVMCSSGSEATIVINQKAVDVDVNGKPVMIITTANSIPSAELTRRFEMVNLDESLNQTKEIMKKHCEYAILGKSQEYNEDYSKAMEHLHRVNVKIPFAGKLYHIFPAENIMMRTKFPRFLDFIKASAAFHQFQRKWENKDTIVADKQDYELAAEVMKKMITNKYLVSLTKKQKRILDFFMEQEEDYKVNAMKVREKLHNFISLPAMQTNLSILTSYGLIDSCMEERERGRDLEVYSLNHKIKNGVEEIEFPDFEELL
jgi:hypothetical protein